MVYVMPSPGNPADIRGMAEVKESWEKRDIEYKEILNQEIKTENSSFAKVELYHLEDIENTEEKELPDEGYFLYWMIGEYTGENTSEVHDCAALLEESVEDLIEQAELHSIKYLLRENLEVSDTG